MKGKFIRKSDSVSSVNADKSDAMPNIVAAVESGVDRRKRLLVFFNGWGMDENVVKHLASDMDVLMFYDYRKLELENNIDLSVYSDVAVFAWSMGVWVASGVVPELFKDKKILYSVAINGTERPIDDTYGIPEKIYLLTERSFNDRVKENFFLRMINNDYLSRPSCGDVMSERTALELKEELTMIRKQYCESLSYVGVESEVCANQPVFEWNIAVISDKDLIISRENQVNYWENHYSKKHNINIVPVFGGHFLFNRYFCWNEFLEF